MNINSRLNNLKNRQLQFSRFPRDRERERERERRSAESFVDFIFYYYHYFMLIFGLWLVLSTSTLRADERSIQRVISLSYKRIMLHYTNREYFPVNCLKFDIIS